ncbi:AfsR/SARP family transcriptional regulator [Amycolatopsis sp. cmx-11-51]|uniref:AfsR/SARP family transcriptional regulator n=1 Tax=Amycolatopsis sp. cmx-11-51 TaxID=2785797 RepID=UPI0039E603C7
MAPTWRGGTELELGPPGRRAVLGLLVLAGGEAMSKQDLADALWGERPPHSAVNVLQTPAAAAGTRAGPAQSGSELLPHVGGGYALRWDTIDVDLPHVRGLVAEANDARRDAETGRAAALFGEAPRWWRGRPLADLPSLTTHPRVVSLVAERRSPLAGYGDAMLAIGAAREVLTDLVEAAADQPLDEPAQARLGPAGDGFPALGPRRPARRRGTAREPASRPWRPAAVTRFTGRGHRTVHFGRTGTGGGGFQWHGGDRGRHGNRGCRETALAVHWAHA